MASRDLALRVKVDGEREYKSAIDGLNQSNKLLNQQMKTLLETYKAGSSSMEGFTKQGEKLSAMLAGEEKKLETARKALAAWEKALATSKEKFGENSEEYKHAQKKVNEWSMTVAKAETQQAKLKNAIAENKKAMDSYSESIENNNGKMVSLGDSLDQISGRLGIHLPANAKKALEGIQGFSAGSVAAMGAAAGAVTATIKVLDELRKMTDESARRADDLLTRSITTGLSTKDLQAFAYASPFVDVESSTLEATLSRMPKIIAQAQDQLESYIEAQERAAAEGKTFSGTLGAQASAFKDLGISLTDQSGRLRDYHEIFWEALQQIGAMGDTTEAATLANELFGRSYSDLKPLMQNAAEAQRLMNEAVEEGYVLNEKQLQMLAEVSDAQETLRLEQEKWTNQISAQFAPANKEAYEALAHLMDIAGTSLVESHLIENTAELIANTVAFMDAGASLISKLPSWLNPIKNLSMQMEYMNKIMAGTLDLLGLTKNELRGYGGLGSDIAGATWKDDVQAWVSAGGTIIDASNYADFDPKTGKLTRQFYIGPTEDVYSYGHMSEAEINRLIGRNAAGTENWRGGLTWVGESGPELVALPRGTRIYSNQESMNAGSVYIENITIDAKNVQEFNDIVELAKSQRIRRRMY